MNLDISRETFHGNLVFNYKKLHLPAKSSNEKERLGEKRSLVHEEGKDLIGISRPDGIGELLDTDPQGGPQRFVEGDGPGEGPYR
jgi:hypothetical protein